MKAAYRELGESPPDSIDIPIIRAEKISVDRNHLASPRRFIRPNIDGKLTSYYEWSSATRYIPRPEFGSMHRVASGVLEYLFYGFDKSNLYLRLDFHGSFFDAPDSVEAEIFFPDRNRKISMVLLPMEPSIRAAIGNIGENLLSDQVTVPPGAFSASFHKVLELGMPFQELGCEEDREIEFFLTIVKTGSVGERWPTYGMFIAELPGKDFEERMWEV